MITGGSIIGSRNRGAGRRIRPVAPTAKRTRRANRAASTNSGVNF